MRDGREVPLGRVDDDQPCDLDLIDKLARMQVAAQRRGGSILLRHATSELTELLALTGLGDLLRSEPPPAAPKPRG